MFESAQEDLVLRAERYIVTDLPVVRYQRRAKHGEHLLGRTTVCRFRMLVRQVRTLPPDPKQRETEEARARAEAHAKVEKEVQGAIGFRRVIDELHKAGKPLITHNGLLVSSITHPRGKHACRRTQRASAR